MSHLLPKFLISTAALLFLMGCGGETAQPKEQPACTKETPLPVADAKIEDDKTVKSVPAKLKATFVEAEGKAPFANKKLALLRFEKPEAAKPDKNGKTWRNVAEQKVVVTTDKGRVGLDSLVAGDYAISLIDENTDSATGQMIVINGKTNFALTNGADLNLGELVVDLK